MFGVQVTKKANVVYQAETDGFVLVGGTLDGCTQGQATEFTVLVDSETPVTHKRITNSGYAGAGGCCPVRKGECWQVATKQSVFVNWMPVE